MEVVCNPLLTLITTTSKWEAVVVDYSGAAILGVADKKYPWLKQTNY